MRSRTLRRIATKTLGLVLLLTASSGVVAGATEDIGWWVTSSPDHVLHCTKNANQHTCRIVYQSGAYQFVFDSFIPGWCQLGWAAAGNNAGAPAQLLVWSVDPNRSCIPWGSAFGDGFGYYEGTWWSVGPAYASEGYVFPRDSRWPWSRGFRLVVY